MIRTGVVADAGELARVFVDAWRTGYRGVVPDAIIDTLDIDDWTVGFEKRLRESSWTTIVWQTGASVAGFARFGADPDRPAPGAGYLASLYVDPTHSGRGIGSALLDSVVQLLTEAGRDDIELWVFTANSRARELYERSGFRPTGRTALDPEWGAERVHYRLAPLRANCGRLDE
ncbi:ribosomal protein S18 acetylase RimI-like enzyme [Nakamurella sp. UYEF19]|uniref:GNAT family N-acetyltransferase n=1 Tax=Nakamurella sp. UYEF19 TaxID=1756392 RepID=UPI00339799FD